MGCVRGIGIEQFPEQRELIGAQVKVCFNYDTTRTIGGKIVRYDMNPPFEVIIALEDGRYVRAVECQYSIERDWLERRMV